MTTLDQIFLLKRKFFVYEANVDRNDRVELHMVYCQFRDEVVGGLHPCSRDEAAQFAALQSQIVDGNYDPTKHKSDFIQ